MKRWGYLFDSDILLRFVIMSRYNDTVCAMTDWTNERIFFDDLDTIGVGLFIGNRTNI